MVLGTHVLQTLYCLRLRRRPTPRPLPLRPRARPLSFRASFHVVVFAGSTTKE